MADHCDSLNENIQKAMNSEDTSIMKVRARYKTANILNQINYTKVFTSKRILIVDDEPYNILGMQLTLSRLGIPGIIDIVDRAYNGLEAVLKVKEGYSTGSHIYGLILTDISMPIMDGYEEASEIRSFYREKRVTQPMIVACTGHIEE